MPLLLGVCTAGFAILAGLGVERLRAPGAGLLCAVLVGAFLGPTVAGRVAPDWFDATWIGDPDDVAELRAIESEQDAARLVESSRTGTGGDFGASVKDEQERILQQRRQEIVGENHAGPKALALACALLVMVGGCVRRRRVEGGTGALLNAGWMVVCCGGAVLLSARLTGTPGTIVESVWVASGGALIATSGIGGQPGRRLLQEWSICACLITLAILVGTVLLNSDPVTPPLLLLLAAVIGSCFMAGNRSRSRLIETSIRRVLAPAAIAITMLDIDLTPTLRFAWVPIVLWLAMGDLRWLVGTTCLRMSGSTWARSALRALPLMGAAWIAVPLAVVGHWTGQLGTVSVVWLLGAAAVAELEGDWRGSAARSIASARRLVERANATDGN